MNDQACFVRATITAGIRTVYYDRGSGPTLVLLHGMFGDYTDWEPVLEPLSRTSRVIAPDLPGFGDSQKPDAPYDGAFFVDWLTSFLKELGISNLVLVGNSFGGEVAILFALAYPNRVRQLVLVSSGGLRFYNEQERSLLREKFSVENLASLTPEVHEWMFRPIFAEKALAWRHYLEKQNAKLSRSDRTEYARALHRSMLTAFSLYFDDELSRLKMPVLLAWGDGDVVFPLPLAEHALAKLPNGELVLLERAGHAPQLENRDAFVGAIERFVRVGMPAGARR